MAIMAQWLNKRWEVSDNKIMALNGVSASVKLKIENNDDKAGSPATIVKALELQNFTFDFDISIVSGTDVRSEYESWTNLIGEYAPFYLAGQLFGSDNIILTEVSLSDTIIDNFGRILKGKITVSFVEFAEEAANKKPTPTEKSSKYPPGITTQMEIDGNSSAVSIGASTADKAAKKPDNMQL